MSAVGNTLDRREFSFTETLALAASAIVAIVAALVLVGGWMLGSSLLVRVGPSLAAMVPSTAGCFHSHSRTHHPAHQGYVGY